MKTAPSKWELFGLLSMMLIVGGGVVVIMGMFFAAPGTTLLKVAAYPLTMAFGAWLYHRWLHHSARRSERRTRKKPRGPAQPRAEVGPIPLPEDEFSLPFEHEDPPRRSRIIE